MRRFAAAAGAAVLLVLCPGARAEIPGLAPSSPVTFGGYVKYLGTANLPRNGDSTIDHLVHQRFDLEARGPRDLSFILGMRNRLFLGDSLDVPGFEKLVTADPGFWDLSWNWWNTDDALANTTLDRLYLDWRPGPFQARAGRQRIGWGMTALWNPNDLFNAFSMFDFDYEERPGTDAVLVGRDLGFASRVEGVWALGKDWDATSLAGRLQANWRGYDLQVLGGKNQIDRVVGVGFAGGLGGAGFRGEATHFSPFRKRWDDRQWERATVATVELDYSVGGRRNLTWRADVLYTSNPEAPPTAGAFVLLPFTARTLSFTRWTGYVDLGFDVTPLSRQSVGGSAYDDGSWYATVANIVSLADDWDLLVLWQHFDGTSDSLFGRDPSDLLFGRMRWSY